MAVTSVRGGAGLGDALYVQSVARYLVLQGYTVEACVDPRWAPVFGPLGASVRVSPFRRERINRLAHYSLRRGRRETTQWEDVCVSAGIPITAPLFLDWKPRSNLVPLAHRPVVLVQMPRAPFARKDGYGLELLPRREAYQAALDALADEVVLVQVGAGEPLYHLDVHIDLANVTTVTELIDLAHHCSGMVGYVSYMVPLAESLCRPAMLVWASAGYQSKHEPVRQITPHKVLHHKNLFRVVHDNDASEVIAAAARSLCDAVRCGRAA